MIFCLQGTPSSNELMDSFQRLQIIPAASPFTSQRTQRRPWGKPRNFSSSSFWPKTIGSHVSSGLWIFNDSTWGSGHRGGKQTHIVGILILLLLVPQVKAQGSSLGDWSALERFYSQVSSFLPPPVIFCLQKCVFVEQTVNKNSEPEFISIFN